jgi:CheY-like chemotaxis protein
MATKPTTPATKPSAKDLLGSLTAGKKPTKKAAATSSRPDLELSPALSTAFERFAGAHALLDVVEARRDQEKDFLNDGCFETWTERLWKAKNRPANPELKIDKNGQTDIQGIYQVQERYTFNAPDVPDGKSLEEVVIEKFVDLFTATGMSQTDAETAATNLVTNELTLSPKPIIDLDRLVNGHYEGEGKNKNFVEATPAEQAIASKLIQMIKARTPEELSEVGCFTDEEESLSLQQEGTEAVLQVRDSGVGIAPDLMPRIFTLFTQAERSLARSQGGLGIGLALVQRLVEMHEGRVEASSALGKGSEFVVRLPVVVAVATNPPSSPAEDAQPTGPSLRVLVVDDNVDAAESLALLMSELGHEVRTAHDGPSALEAALECRPNVVLLDIGLPGLDGYEVAKRMRQQPVLQNVVLVAMTGYGKESDRQRAQEAGFDHHLVKPAKLEKVQQILASVSEKTT